MLAHSYRQPAHRFCLLADIVVLESTTGGHVLLSNMGPRAPHTPAIRFQHNRSADAVIDILMALSPSADKRSVPTLDSSWLARLVGKVQGHRFLTCCLVLALLVLLCCNVLDWTNFSLSLMLFAVKRLAYLPFAQRRTATATRSLACRRASGHLGRSSCARRRLSYRTSHE